MGNKNTTINKNQIIQHQGGNIASSSGNSPTINEQEKAEIKAREKAEIKLDIQNLLTRKKHKLLDEYRYKNFVIKTLSEKGRSLTTTEKRAV